MALSIKNQVVTSVVDTASQINIQQQKSVQDNASDTLSLNFTMEAYSLPPGKTLDTEWTQLTKGDIANIRDISIFLTSTPQDENIDILITSLPNPNEGAGTPKTFTMRDMFVSTTAMSSNQTIWARNPGASVATLLVILGGVNA